MSNDRERIDRALEVIAEHGGADGAHHKQWALDQVVRVLTGCPPETATAVDCNGTLYTYERLGCSEEYAEWLRGYMDGDDGPHTYEWDTGIP